jgi:hypothetical protein
MTAGHFGGHTIVSLPVVRLICPVAHSKAETKPKIIV